MVGGLLLASPSSRAVSSDQATRVFLVTSSYGVMAGSLTGLASLAFYKDPGNHLKNVAIGASLGLYAGILMGAYMIYVVPEQNRPRRPREEDLDSFELDSSLDLQKSERRWTPYVWMDPQGGLNGGLTWAF